VSFELRAGPFQRYWHDALRRVRPGLAAPERRLSLLLHPGLDDSRHLDLPSPI